MVDFLCSGTVAGFGTASFGTAVAGTSYGSSFAAIASCSCSPALASSCFSQRWVHKKMGSKESRRMVSNLRVGS
jgi:hypothetical protein